MGERRRAVAVSRARLKLQYTFLHQLLVGVQKLSVGLFSLPSPSSSLSSSLPAFLLALYALFHGSQKSRGGGWRALGATSPRVSSLVGDSHRRAPDSGSSGGGTEGSGHGERVARAPTCGQASPTLHRHLVPSSLLSRENCDRSRDFSCDPGAYLLQPSFLHPLSVLLCKGV